MPRRPNSPRKRRTREHIIADLGVNFVERQVLLSGNTVERWVHDYGLDLVLFSYSADGEPESGMTLLQVKATDHLKTTSDGRFVTCRIERAHLRAWLTEPMPVILILYDAVNDRAFWLYVQTAFPGARRFQMARGSDRLTIRIPSSQKFDVIALTRLTAYGQRIVAKMKGIQHEDE